MHLHNKAVLPNEEASNVVVFKTDIDLKTGLNTLQNFIWCIVFDLGVLNLDILWSYCLKNVLVLKPKKF